MMAIDPVSVVIETKPDAIEVRQGTASEIMLVQRDATLGEVDVIHVDEAHAEALCAAIMRQANAIRARRRR